VNHTATLQVSGVTLQRGLRVLLRGLSFTLEPGGALELRAPNGAGKTTLLRAIAGLHRPVAGSIRLEGEGPTPDASHADRLMYLGHLDAVKGGESARRQLDVWAAVLGAPASAVDAAARHLGIAGQMELPGAVLSAGQRRRVALARLLLADRPLWLLDEPAAPLDAAGRALLGDLLDSHRSRGGMVVTAVHDTPPGRPMQRLELVP
jgi:heme exporter protein A